MCGVIDNLHWDRTKLNSLVNIDMCKKICLISLPVNPIKNKLIWGPSKNGKFAVKSATWLQNKNNQSDARFSLLRKMWKLSIPTKVKIFAWLFIQGRLPTRSRLGKFVKNIDKIWLFIQGRLHTRINYIFS